MDHSKNEHYRVFVCHMNDIFPINVKEPLSYLGH